MTNDIRHIPPQSLEAEMSILGGILIDNDAINRVLEMLTPEDFYRESHRKIFQAMMKLSDLREPCDFITMTDMLKKAGELEEIGGAAYLATLVDYVPTAANIAYYCKIVKEKSAGRHLCAHAQEIITRVRDERPVGEIVDEARRALDVLGATMEGVHGINADDLIDFKSRAEGYQRYVKQLDKLRFKTGFDLLDREIRGVAPGEVLVIVAYSGTFKTAYLQHLLLHSARTTGFYSLFFSLEMPAVKIFEREAAMQASVTGRQVETAWREGAKLGQTIFADCVRNGSQGLLVCDRPKLTIEQVGHYIDAARRKGTVGAVGIDYLGLMASPGKTLFERTAYLAPELKNMAKLKDVPLIVLSQISREAAKSGAEIEAHSAKGGGDIEASADFMLGMQMVGQDQLVMKILKNRNGRAGLSFLVDLDRPTLQFRGLSPYTPPQRSKGVEI